MGSPRVAPRLAPHPGKEAVERFWLLYTPVWAVAAGLVMVTGLAEAWGDVELMAFGVLVGGAAAVGPVVTRPPSERGIPLTRTVSFKLSLSVVGLAFGLNYSQTPFFFDVLHMHYGFAANVTIERNPVFLYFLTIAYFATYCALCLQMYRWLRARWSGGGAVAWIVAPVTMAGLETALNANPFMKSLFCYDDMVFMAWFGTLAYSVSFILALPMWRAIDESPGESVGWTSVVVWVAAVVYADLLVIDFLRFNVAPMFTTVTEGTGLRDFATSCLVPPG